jgi:hypothetical protein
MPRHRDALVNFEVPRDWIDRSVVAYSAPTPTGVNLVMTRDRLEDDEDLPQYAARQLDDIAERMRGFTIEEVVEHEIAGRRAFTTRFRSAGTDGPLVQRLTLIALPDRRVVAFTTTAPARDAEQLAPLFERIISSVQLESEG